MALPTWNQGRGSPAASAVVRGALGGAASVAVAPSDCITIAGCFDTEAGEFASCVGELLPMRIMTTRRTTIITQKTMTPMTIPAMAPGDTTSEAALEAAAATTPTNGVIDGTAG